MVRSHLCHGCAPSLNRVHSATASRLNSSVTRRFVVFSILHLLAPQSLSAVSGQPGEEPSAKKDRAVIVTGAGQGICRAVAERFAEEGARVAVVDLFKGRAEQVADAIRQQGGTAIALECDVASSASVNAMVQATIDAFGTVDVLVNGAGGYRRFT